MPPLVIDNDMERVYFLIVKRMYQAFCKDAVTLNSSVEAECNGIRYHWDGVAYKSKGWHSLFPDTVLRTEAVPAFSIGEELTPVGHGTASFKSPEVKAYTDDTLFQTLMEIRGATHSEGIAKDIVHLEASGLIERDAWGQIFLTERGLSLYFIIKSMKIADIAKVKEIDDMMGQLLRDKIPASSYDRDLKQFTRDITAEILSCAKFFPCREDDIECPHCSEGVMKTFGRVAMCDNPDCGSLHLPPVLRRDSDPRGTHIAHQDRLNSHNLRLPCPQWQIFLCQGRAQRQRPAPSVKQKQSIHRLIPS